MQPVGRLTDAAELDLERGLPPLLTLGRHHRRHATAQVAAEPLCHAQCLWLAARLGVLVPG